MPVELECDLFQHTSQNASLTSCFLIEVSLGVLDTRQDAVMVLVSGWELKPCTTGSLSGLTVDYTLVLPACSLRCSLPLV